MNRQLSFRIQIKANGVHLGIITKGHGRGQGLLIVQQLLMQYDYVILSSLLLEGQYTQSLSVFYGTSSS